MRFVAVFFVSLFASLAMPASAGEPRIALVIGNNDYASGLLPLTNAVSDAALIGGVLEQAGFEVEVRDDLDRTTMQAELKNFRQRLQAAGPGAVGLFYFAGHGLQSHNINYLMPIDAPVGQPDDISRNGFEAEEVLWAMLKGGAETNILILDACRPSGVPKVLRQIAEAGLNDVDTTGVDDRSVMVFYSTSPGETAADGEDGNSPFAKALADNLLIPDLSLHDLALNLRWQMKGTGQVPRESGTMWRKFAFVGEPK